MKMRSLALITVSATLGLSGLAAGNDNSKSDYQCHTPGVYDGGYDVWISQDNAAGTAEVTVGKDSFFGVRNRVTYAVRVTQSGQDTVFQGDGLTLTKSGNRAKFTAVKAGAAIEDDLVCGPEG